MQKAMIDVIFTIRLGIEDNKVNREHLSRFSEFLGKKYLTLAGNFLRDVLLAAQVPFEGAMSTKLMNNVEDDVFKEYRHPQPAAGHKWTLDDLPIKHNLLIWIRLENQWLQARTEVKGQSSNIIIEPENVKIPISEALFLKW
mgnify:CR=1 FL=1